LDSGVLERCSMTSKYEIIVEPRNVYTISVWDGIDSYGDYNDLFKKFTEITANDVVNLRVSSHGGRCDVGFEIYDRLKLLECPIHVTVPYPTYSMGAILALCGNFLKVEPGAFLMFHDYSFGTRGKGNEVFKQTEAYKEVFKYRFNQICQPFLTKKECEKVLNGQDLYVKWNDDNLENRIRRHFDAARG
jgi:ATP-dependent protease ClpP protease subunit